MLTNMALFCEFAMATRLSSVTKTSEERVITVCNPALARYLCTRNAVSSATPFSGMIFEGIPPLSCPPCPGSITTVENDAASRVGPDATAKITSAKKQARLEYDEIRWLILFDVTL